MKIKLVFSYIIFIFLIIFGYNNCVAQAINPKKLSKEIDALKLNKNYRSNKEYLILTNKLAYYYADNLPDSALQMLVNQPELCKQVEYYEGEVDALKIRGTAYQMKGNFKKALDWFELSLEKAKQHNYEDAIPAIQSNIGMVFTNQGNYTKALQNFFLALKGAELIKNRVLAGRIWNNIGIVYFFQGDLQKSMEAYQKFLQISEQDQNIEGIIFANNNIGEIHLEQNDLKAALFSFELANKLAEKEKNITLQISSTKNLGDVYFKLLEIDTAIIFYERALSLSQQNGNKPASCKALIGLAKAYNFEKEYDTAIRKSDAAISLAESMKHRQLARDAYQIKSIIYENKGEGILALENYKIFKSYSDSLKNIESQKASDLLKTNFDLSLKELDYQKNEITQRWIIFSFIAAFISMLLIAFIINRNRKREKLSNRLLKEKNQDIEIQKSVLEKTLIELKSAQAKLIQSEKLASLGELTAGIAHEIQNPLNFVNNFSELSGELIDEMNEEIDKGNLDEVRAISGDLKLNFEKITHHGKRASSIVKGMLEHSRASSGLKELTDLNTLADEYLRLSYHGLRAKDNSGPTSRFNSDFKTDFDKDLPKIPVVPQDFGRVLLNLINNAFYACKNVKNPLVEVKTEKIEQSVIISIKDNGLGMSESTKAKIFQPFFTTKPTGEGTGLGLSLAYDIVVKGHGGTIECESLEGEGTTFIIKLPILNN